MTIEHSSFISRRALVSAIAASVGLTACSDIIGPPAAPKIYLLRPATSDLSGVKVQWILAVALPDAPHNLDSGRIAINLDANTQDYYADAVWQDQLPSLVQRRLIEAFEASGRIENVGAELDEVRADYLLVTEIRDFEAVYSKPATAPTTVVKLEARLVANRDHNVVARTMVSKVVVASQNSISSAVDAFDLSLGEAIGQIVTWTLSAAPPIGKS